MQIVSFSEFARLRAAKIQPDQMATPAQAAPVADRWAMLHAPAHESMDQAVIKASTLEAGFWDDLQFRIAYPTHKMRFH